MRYPITLTPDDNDTLLVASPDFPELKTFGKDESDASRHAADALVTVIAGRIADRQPVPPPSAVKGPSAALAAGETLKIALYQAMAADRVDRPELARRIDRQPAAVDRLLDLLQASRLDDVEAALRALGRQVTVVVDTAA